MKEIKQNQFSDIVTLNMKLSKVFLRNVHQKTLSLKAVDGRTNTNQIIIR